MKNNFFVILKYSLKPKIFTKGFLIFSLIMVVGAMVICNGIVFLSMSSSESSEPVNIYVYSEDEDLSQNFIDSSTYLEIPDNYTFEVSDEIVDVTDTSDVSLDIDNKIAYTEMGLDIESGSVVSQMFTAYDTSTFLIDNDLTIDQLQSSQSIGSFEEEDINSITEPDSTNNALLYPITYGTTLVFYFIFVFAINFIGQEIFEEKKSRAMEIIITNISPTSHLLAKVTSNILSVVITLLVLMISVVIGIISAILISDIDIQPIIDIVSDFLSASNITIDSTLVVATIMLIVNSLVSLISIVTIVGVFASTVANQEDYQRVVTPLMLIVILPFFIGIIPGMDSLKEILAYVPIVSTYFIGPQYISANMGNLNLLLSLGINVIFLILIIKLLVPIYRVGVLNYSSRPLKEILKMSREDKKYKKSHK